ncbi:MAG: hypothetical protein K2X82_23510 [Gemmataceae bacterium]|nr:hypothetical protein [Gemmataceae bacterium]
MWPFRPKHMVESVLVELARGYAAGTVVIPGGEPPDTTPAVTVEPEAGDEIVIRVTEVKASGARVQTGPTGEARGRRIVIEMTPDEARQLVAGTPTPAA